MYGVQLYTLRGETSLAETLHRLAALGYDAVEPYDLLTDPAGLRDLLDATGLAVRSAHAPLLGERREEVAAAAKVIGLDTLVVPYIASEEFAADVRGSAARVNEAAAWAAGHGLRVGYHNHFWEIDAIGEFAGALDPDVFLEIDVYWAAVGGADVPALLRELGERVRFLHVKDGPGTVEDAMSAVGDGTLPIPEILAAAPHAMRVVELDRHDGDMWAAVERSLAYLRGVEG